MKMAWPTQAVMEEPFRLESVTPAAAPAGSEGVWCRYVISQGNNQISGLRAGSLSEVRPQIDQMIEHLNERREGKLRSKAR
jgi:hypothetical protein